MSNVRECQSVAGCQINEISYFFMFYLKSLNECEGKIQ